MRIPRIVPCFVVCLVVPSALACTFQHELPTQSEAREQASLCEQLTAESAAGSESQLSDRRTRIAELRDAYCAPESSWSRCLGITRLDPGDPGRACWERARPTIDCLLDAPDEGASRCLPPPEDRCNPWAEHAASPASPLCNEGKVTTRQESTDGVSRVDFGYDDCADGLTYAMTCQLETDGCFVDCTCGTGATGTKAVFLVHDDSWMSQLWQRCGFPEEAGGLGGAPGGP